jgi:hypothetical protein
MQNIVRMINRDAGINSDLRDFEDPPNEIIDILRVMKEKVEGDYLLKCIDML